MAFVDRRGEVVAKYQRGRREVNVKKVAEWLDANPDGTTLQCSNDLGLCRATVWSIGKEIKKMEEEGK